MRLTRLQEALAKRILAGCGFVSYRHPDLGREDIDSGKWYIMTPYHDEDGRTCGAMLAKNALMPIGDGDYALTDEAKAYLSEKSGD